MNYGILYYGGLVALGGVIITWCLMWSRKERERKASAKFLLKLAGYRFTSWSQLQAAWLARGVRFTLDGGPFDENRHGNLLDTLRVLDETACAEFGNWIE